MESGDGLIVRVRPRAGSLSVAAVRAIALAATRFGNGHIDLTRRANLQIRGVTAAALSGIQEAIDDLGLLDASPEVEAVRNIIVSPLAGIDPGETLDVRPLASALERLIAADAGLWRLPPKFGFVIDGGGALPLADERADIRLEAVHRDGAAAVAIGIDRAGGTIWLGGTTPEGSPRAAVRVAAAFLTTQPAGGRARLRDVGAGAIDAIARAIMPFIDPVEMVRGERSGSARLGALRDKDQVFAICIAAPFGRVEADMLRGLADAAAAAGVPEVRVSPWRAFYLPVSAEEKCAGLLDAARRLGFVTDPEDPVLRIEACPGAPACSSAALDTRTAALAISRLLPRLDGIRRVHVSGCAKGCACSAPADLVLVGGRDRFGVVRKGRADAAPESFILPHDLDQLPALIANGGER
jgi:precorrin-3B synthase